MATAGPDGRTRVSPVRTAAKVFLRIGVATTLCAFIYGVIYYLTNGFLDVDSLSPLQHFGYWNLAVMGAFLCMGLTMLGLGALLMALGRQR